jgi:hypothetical protein
LNSTTWNLAYPAADRVVLRSLPPDNPHIWDEGRWEGRERPVSHWGLGALNWQPRAAPGKYSVRVTANGKQQTQSFEVWRDVTLPSSDAELAAGTAFQRKVVAAMNEAADVINRIEIMRMKVEDLQKANASSPELTRALDALYKRMYETELHFLSRTEMHSDDKWYVEKYKVYFNLIWLLAEVGGGGGDVMGGAGYQPTMAATGVIETLTGDLRTGKNAFAALAREVDAFNKAHAGRLPAITDTLAK